MDAKEIAISAFHTADWINGALSGGIEAPRIIKNVTQENNKVVIEFTYHELCGLTDCPYHDLRAGKMYTDEFEFNDNKLTLNGNDDYLGTHGFDDDFIIEAVDKFHSDYPMMVNKYAA